MENYLKVDKIQESYENKPPLKASLDEIIRVCQIDSTDLKDIERGNVQDIIKKHNNNDSVKMFILILNMIDYNTYCEMFEN